MIIIRMTGGLGNQMFQYALFLKLRSMGKEVKLDDKTEYEMDNARPLSLWVYGITYEPANRDEINNLTDGKMDFFSRLRRKLTGRKTLEYAEKPFIFDPQVLEQDPAYLTGYFQSEKYFASVIQQVREAFTFTKQLTDKAGQYFCDMKQTIEQTTSVSVHIRRGDYLDNQEKYGNICTDEYYLAAAKQIRKNFPDATFFLFSNDADWVEEWAKEIFGTRVIVIRGANEDTGYLDMLLMSKCKHHIIANSSFSWWGAWLNPSESKMVIAPDRWVNEQDDEDIYTEDMIRISATGEVTSKKTRMEGKSK